MKKEAYGVIKNLKIFYDSYSMWQLSPNLLKSMSLGSCQSFCIFFLLKCIPFILCIFKNNIIIKVSSFVHFQITTGAILHFCKIQLPTFAVDHLGHSCNCFWMVICQRNVFFLSEIWTEIYITTDSFIEIKIRNTPWKFI